MLVDVFNRSGIIDFIGVIYLRRLRILLFYAVINSPCIAFSVDSCNSELSVFIFYFSFVFLQ